MFQENIIKAEMEERGINISYVANSLMTIESKQILIGKLYVAVFKYH